jgi:hypothetical protein
MLRGTTRRPASSENAAAQVDHGRSAATWRAAISARPQAGVERDGAAASHWLRGQVNLVISVPEIPPGSALHLVHWAPFVTLTSIANDETANWAGWAVHWFRVAHPWDPITYQVNVETGYAVRDSDGLLLRLGYEITLAGTFAQAPAEPIIW